MGSSFLFFVGCDVPAFSLAVMCRLVLSFLQAQNPCDEFMASRNKLTKRKQHRLGSAVR